MYKFTEENEAKVNKNQDTIATIKANPKSNYHQVIKDLGLGMLFDYTLELHQADTSWITMWVEAYVKGEKQEGNLLEHQFGLSPEKYKKGHLGFIVLNPGEPKTSLQIYSPSGSAGLDKVPKDISLPEAALTGDYVIKNNKIGLTSGQTKILALYRQETDDYIKMYGNLDEEAIGKIIEESESVLLFKIKVEKKQ